MAEYLKLAEVARRLDISEKTARRMVKAGKLPAVFIGNAYRVTEEDIAAYLRSARVEPGKALRRSPSEPSFNDMLAEERREPEYLQELLRGRGIEVNTSEAVVLSQYLEVAEHPPTGPYVIGHVVREDEPVDHERVKGILAYGIGMGWFSPEETRAACEKLEPELVGSGRETA